MRAGTTQRGGSKPRIDNCAPRVNRIRTKRLSTKVLSDRGVAAHCPSGVRGSSCRQKLHPILLDAHLCSFLWLARLRLLAQVYVSTLTVGCPNCVNCTTKPSAPDAMMSRAKFEPADDHPG